MVGESSLGLSQNMNEKNIRIRKRGIKKRNELREGTCLVNGGVCYSKRVEAEQAEGDVTMSE